MKIDFQPINTLSIATAQRIYEETFPIEERRPSKEWCKMCEQHPFFHAMTINTEGEIRGIMTYWILPTCYYIEHFAITMEQRGEGFGSAALRLFLSSHTDRIVILEVEPPETEFTQRRIRFYERHGFKLLSYPYLQPPYRHGDSPLPLNLMTNRKIEAERKIQETIKAIHKEVYGAMG